MNERQHKIITLLTRMVFCARRGWGRRGWPRPCPPSQPSGGRAVDRGTFNFSNFPLEHSLQSSGAQRRKVVQHPTWAQEPCQKSCNFKLAELSCCLSETNKSLQKLNTILPAYCRYPPSSVPPLPISAAMQSKFHPRYKAVNDISQNTVSPIGNTCNKDLC